jgi:hypothetical protein
MKQLLHLIIGLGAYFASSWYFGPQLFGAYAAIGSLLWSFVFYFVVFF